MHKMPKKSKNQTNADNRYDLMKKLASNDVSKVKEDYLVKNSSRSSSLSELIIDSSAIPKSYRNRNNG
jgi:hypothetical protein